MSVSPKNSELHPVPQPPLNLDVSMPELTRALLDLESVSGNERTIADAVHTALSFCPHLHLTRDGDAIIARTESRRCLELRGRVLRGAYPHYPRRSPGYRAPAYRRGFPGYCALYGA